MNVKIDQDRHFISMGSERRATYSDQNPFEVEVTYVHLSRGLVPCVIGIYKTNTRPEDPKDGSAIVHIDDAVLNYRFEKAQGANGHA